MDLKRIRQKIIHQLWDTYRKSSAQIIPIENHLKQHGIHTLPLDHFAVIDLPGPETGIQQLKPLFTAIGYMSRGSDYLPSKQNDFHWMTEIDSPHARAADVLPQVVVADFRLDEMPSEIRTIIEKYSRQALPSPVKQIEALAARVDAGDAQAEKLLTAIFTAYLIGRDWPLPTSREFHTVHEFNELLAWVLVFGRQPNHFTISVHLLEKFASLADFNHFIETEAQVPLNQEGGKIKGGPAYGIEQGSTAGTTRQVQLQDGVIELPTDFVEFVWRHPVAKAQQRPERWDDYFTGFIANFANDVIESLLTSPTEQ